ncbi:hypothetical protein ACGF13_35265 [Kitasatospora sp. NPDC048286]|uniref:hypothetical protein n=1 Tax=Kitasatospora sp. NPDC048286 TaxID=3364047 RepID=UPI003719E8B5
MTDEPLSVSLADLRGAFDVLLSRLEAATAGDAVALDQDYFWAVPQDELYDVTREPGDLTIGSLGESWGQVRELLADRDRAVGHHLVWLADVLRAVGREYPA